MSGTSSWKPFLVDVFRAVFQIAGVALAMLAGVLLTFFPMAFLVAATARPTTNKFGESEAEHKDKYIEAGSSGHWEYWASAWSFLKWWNNVEDGTLGEPSGRHSSNVKGKERTWWNQVLWLFRNPFNGKREIPLFICMVNDCTVTHYGTYDLSDKGPIQTGMFLCKAVHRSTREVYYNFRCVYQWPMFGPRLARVIAFILRSDQATVLEWSRDRVFQFKAGYKIQPSHRHTIQDADDADKAFTLNIQPSSKAG